jgi:hypothetical protein
MLWGQRPHPSWPRIVTGIHFYVVIVALEFGAEEHLGKDTPYKLPAERGQSDISPKDSRGPADEAISV